VDAAGRAPVFLTIDFSFGCRVPESFMPTISKPSTAAIMNRLLVLHQRSLPMFLTYASPWTASHDEQALEALRHLVEDQKRLAGQIADYMLERRWRMDPGEFPLEFTGLHDVSLDYLWPKLIDAQRRDIREIQASIAGLNSDPYARALAEEALGSAKGHLESLEEAAQSMTSKKA
jgi:hypothetical protein